jgi:hypothetical protein
LKYRALAVAATAALALSAPAVAKTKWTAATSASLHVRSDEQDADRSLYAVCAEPGVVELFIGADEAVGKGEGEPVKLRAESDGKSATISGVSRKSIDFEGSRGGTELVTRIFLFNDEFFKVLASGKPVKLSGSLKKPVTWNHPGMADAVKKFTKACAPL